MDGEQSISLHVIEAVAAYEGVEPEALRSPLHSAIDPDALDALFRSADGEQGAVSVEFTYKGYRIQVDGPDAITVSEPAREADPQKEAV
ncbi:HalOD1 output domain-containing protein [Halopiger xanaduensis]|uniref:Halobacterial output domain-containing protein n=1 Tax=Halopiger xanaduensis (strain DSM 18323 / JCM 14033 / SH-6) TaxID=797210 RepID=F8D6I6_HALXS|nr:HalOD1 output domain-containing protein [Halopiger xanaduensis]AEH36575.1 hypothetical protein Halxa_1948 [Halopiger xanaduensis SH-6]